MNKVYRPKQKKIGFPIVILIEEEKNINPFCITNMFIVLILNSMLQKMNSLPPKIYSIYDNHACLLDRGHGNKNLWVTSLGQGLQFPHL